MDEVERDHIMNVFLEATPSDTNERTASTGEVNKSIGITKEAWKTQDLTSRACSLPLPCPMVSWWSIQLQNNGLVRAEDVTMGERSVVGVHRSTVGLGAKKIDGSVIVLKSEGRGLAAVGVVNFHSFKAGNK